MIDIIVKANIIILFLHSKLIQKLNIANDISETLAFPTEFPPHCQSALYFPPKTDTTQVWLAGGAEQSARPPIPAISKAFVDGTYMVCFSDLWRCTEQVPG